MASRQGQVPEAYRTVSQIHPALSLVLMPWYSLLISPWCVFGQTEANVVQIWFCLAGWVSKGGTSQPHRPERSGVEGSEEVGDKMGAGMETDSLPKSLEHSSQSPKQPSSLHQLQAIPLKCSSQSRAPHSAHEQLVHTHTHTHTHTLCLVTDWA